MIATPLQCYFDLHDILHAGSAKKIYEETSDKLQTKEYSVRGLPEKMNVKIICATDDPADPLAHYKKTIRDGWHVKVNPAFRPDKAMNVDEAAAAIVLWAD
jgi:glucuronate isomerase